MPNRDSLKHHATDSGGQGAGGDQRAVQIEVIVDHALGGEALAGASVGAIGVGVAEGAVGVELAKGFGETAGIVGPEVKGGVAPDFAEAGNIVGDDGATRESGVERGHAKRLVTRSGGIDCST